MPPAGSAGGRRRRGGWQAPQCLPGPAHTGTKSQTAQCQQGWLCYSTRAESLAYNCSENLCGYVVHTTTQLGPHLVNSHVTVCYSITPVIHLMTHSYTCPLSHSLTYQLTPVGRRLQIRHNWCHARQHHLRSSSGIRSWMCCSSTWLPSTAEL